MPLPRSPFCGWFVGAFLLLLSPALRAETPWSVRVWRTSDGLSGTYVVGVAEDAEGFLWVVAGTDLERFDGVSFQPFSFEHFVTPAAQKIRVFDRRPGGGLVFVLQDGSIANVHDGRVEITAANLPHERARVEALCATAEGTCFATCSDESVWRMRDGVAESIGEMQGLPPGAHARLTVDAGGRLWFTKGDWVGLWRSGKFTTLHRFPTGSYPHVAPARAGGVWLAAGGSLYRFGEDRPLERIGEVPPQHVTVRPTVLLEDRSGGVWFGTYASGLFHFDGPRAEAVPISHRQVTSLTEDREGDIWAGTSGGGLNQIQPRALIIEGEETGVPGRAVQAICEDTTHRLWAVTQNGALVTRTDKTWEPPGGLSVTGTVASVAADPSGAVWFATKNRQLHRWADGRETTWTVDDGLVASPSVLLVSRRGGLWIGGARPVSLQRIRDGRWQNFALPSMGGSIRGMAEDDAGNLWLAAGHQLFRVAPDDQVVDESKSIAAIEHSIRTIQVTDDGSVWIAYEHVGLARLKGGMVRQITAANGLFDDNLEFMLSDHRGWMWFAANQSIFKINQAELDAFADGHTQRVHSLRYGREQGVHAVFGESVGALLHSDGQIWIPMATSLAIIDPSRQPAEAPPAPVVITAIKVDGRTLAVHRGLAAIADGADIASASLRLAPALRQLEIDFTALSYRAPNNVRFRYRLSPFDDRWTEAGTRRVADYPRLAPGAYVFWVQACNSDGLWNEAGAQLAFAVAPFFWDTWWFRALAIAVFTGAIFGIARAVSLRRLRARLRAAEKETAVERERTRIARDIHDDLGGRLTKIVLLSGLAARETTEPEKANARVAEISDTARQLIKSLDETVWAVNPRNDTLPDLISYLGQFTVNHLRSAEISCRLDLPDDPAARLVPADVRHHLFLAVKEALTNIVRHAHATEVALRASTTATELRIQVEDNGRGFDVSREPIDRESNGLRNIRERLTQIGGQFEIESRPGLTRLSLIWPWPDGR